MSDATSMTIEDYGRSGWDAYIHCRDKATPAGQGTLDVWASLQPEDTWPEALTEEQRIVVRGIRDRRDVMVGTAAKIGDAAAGFLDRFIAASYEGSEDCEVVG